MADPLIKLKITSAVCSSVAVIMTVYRLWIRRHRLWADDACAAFALVILCIQIVSVFLHLPLPNTLPQTSRVAAYYLMAYTFYAVIWLSRLSILFSILRIHPSPSGRRRLLYVAGAFLAAAIFLMAQLLWECEPLAQKSATPSWKEEANPQCPLPRVVAICQLVTDVIADAILLLSPLNVLRGLADKGLRRRLGVIFSTCVITTIVSLVHAAYIINRAGIKVLISAIVEDCISLIVANIPVVVAATISLSSEHDYVDTFQTHSLRFRSLKSRGTIYTYDTSNNVDNTTVRAGTMINLALETINEEEPRSPGARDSTLLGSPLSEVSKPIPDSIIVPIEREKGKENKLLV
ncbi:hypothetical protein K435DRAFT_749615 [Dendrothele bispora CBS 962.96]|uniref:Rhodopsin domain-containing protein n=1 Tax=Dendrothele bispora (strain CBS 962.96) TaxID=1314807 RepID=A0A4S8MHY8_DENBC|nr:hypothetical protein K435DRAFT_749615 [Dendrothele bispora CBS 962.96]